jgi:hypothetical protein
MLARSSSLCIIGALTCARMCCRPRFDHHVKVNFQGSGDEPPPPEDALFVFELYDWDKFGDGNVLGTNEH